MSRLIQENTRSSRILRLLNKNNVIVHHERERKTESPLPKECTFNDSDWKALEGMIDDELSSDRNLKAEDLCCDMDLLEVPTKLNQISNDDHSDDVTVILDSSEVTPIPSSNVDFDSPSPTSLLASAPEQQVSVPDDQDLDTTIVSPNIDIPSVPSLVPEDQDLDTTIVSPNTDIPSIPSLITIPECDSPLMTVSESESASTVNKSKRKSTFKVNPGKKRKRCKENWIDIKRKAAVNTGQEYVSRNGKVRNKRVMGPTCKNTCKLKCYEHFNETTRQKIHSSFWQMADHSKQWEFINKFTKKLNKRRFTTESTSRRQFTTQYFLPAPAENQNQPCEHRRVCLKVFLNTLSITDQFVRTAHQKLNQEGITLPDNRGKHPNHIVKKDSTMIKSVCDHVASFQPVESHYTRKNTSKLYLDNNLSMKKMFSLYNEWDNLQLYNNTAQTLRQYTDIVNENMNIAFFAPKKDLCDKCHSFSNEKSPTEEQIDAHNRHIENKSIAREFKNSDKVLSQNSSEVVCATFDFQKILNCPHGDVGLFYYKRKLSVYNFTLFDIGKKEGTCFMWTECTGKRGANEVSSCLLQFVKTKVEQGAKKFLFWSDNCAGQNRNRIVYSLYMYLAKEYKIDITHRFLEQGHTQNEGDSVHALIERESKGKMIYTPDQWFALVRWCKTNGTPYNVVEMTQDDFFDFKGLLDDRKWKKDIRNENVKWNSIKEISVSKEEPNYLYFKYNLKDNASCLNTKIETRSRGRRRETDELNLTYTQALPLQEAKYKDLIHLCNTGAIPKEYHQYFRNLKYSNTPSGENSDDSD